MTGTDRIGPSWTQRADGGWNVGDPGRAEAVVRLPAVVAPRRADITADAARAGSLEFRAAGIRGPGHFENGMPRQDAYAVVTAGAERWLVGCVADGVSSARLSHRAADLACARITDVLRDALDAGIGDLHDLPWAAAAETAAAAIVEEFRRRLKGSGEFTQADVRQEMSTTATAFVVATEAGPDGGYPAAVAVITGDSSAHLLRDGAWEPLTEPKADASQPVEALPRTVTPASQVCELRPGDLLLVATDGIGDPLGSGTGEVGRFLATQWQRPPAPIAFAQQIDFSRKTFADDRTAVAVWVQ